MYQHIGSKHMPAGTVRKFLLRSSRPPWASQDRTQQARGIDHHRGACSRCAGPHDCPFGSKQMNFDHMTLYQRSSMIELQPCVVSKLRFCPLCPLKFPLRTSKQSRPATSIGPHSCALNCERARRSWVCWLASSILQKAYCSFTAYLDSFVLWISLDFRYLQMIKQVWDFKGYLCWWLQFLDVVMPLHLDDWVSFRYDIRRLPVDNPQCRLALSCRPTPLHLMVP